MQTFDIASVYHSKKYGKDIIKNYDKYMLELDNLENIIAQNNNKDIYTQSLTALNDSSTVFDGIEQPEFSKENFQQLQSILKPQFNYGFLKDQALMVANKQFFLEQQNSTQALNQIIGITLPIGSVLYFQQPLDTTINYGIIFGKYVLRFFGYSEKNNTPMNLYEYVLQGDDYDRIGYSFNFYKVKQSSTYMQTQADNYQFQVKNLFSGLNDYTMQEFPDKYDAYASLNVTISAGQIPQHFHYKSLSLGYDLIVNEATYKDSSHYMDDAYNMSQYLSQEAGYYLPLYSKDVGKYLTLDFKNEFDNKTNAYIGKPTVFETQTQQEKGWLDKLLYMDGYTWGGQYHNYLKVYQLEDNSLYSLPTFSIDKDTYNRPMHNSYYNVIDRDTNNKYTHFKITTSKSYKPSGVLGNMQTKYTNALPNTFYYKHKIYETDESVNSPPFVGFFDTGNYIDLGTSNNVLQQKLHDNIKTVGNKYYNQDYENDTRKYIYAKGENNQDYKDEVKDSQYPEKQITNHTIHMTHGNPNIQSFSYTFITDTPRKFLYMYVIEDYVSNIKSIDQDKYVFFTNTM